MHVTNKPVLGHVHKRWLDRDPYSDCEHRLYYFCAEKYFALRISLWELCVCANRIIRRKARCGWNFTFFVWRNLQIDRQNPPTLLASNTSTIAPVLFPLWRYIFLNLNGIEYKDTSQRRRDSGWKQLPMTRLMHLTLIFRTQNGVVIVKDPYKNDLP